MEDEEKELSKHLHDDKAISAALNEKPSFLKWVTPHIPNHIFL